MVGMLYAVRTYARDLHISHLLEEFSRHICSTPCSTLTRLSVPLGLVESSGAEALGRLRQRTELLFIEAETSWRTRPPPAK